MDELKCRYCGATTTKNGQPFKNKSSLNTHINIHCPNFKGSADADRGGGHVHKWILLKPISAAHQRAIQSGFTKICECGEIE